MVSAGFGLSYLFQGPRAAMAAARRTDTPGTPETTETPAPAGSASTGSASTGSAPTGSGDAGSGNAVPAADR